jgi:lipoate---protein ligase
VKLLDLTLATPAENLACDEALLNLCENERVEILRFWESRQPFVVVGYGNQVAAEVNVEECRRRRVPILRRCSGGGTVLQGPGCLNFNLTLALPEEGPLTTVTGTNEFVMERNRAAMEALLDVKVSVQGHTDLAFLAPDASEQWFKFSGNAQRRRRRALVFHGTILHAFELSLIDALLPFPSAQPDYRKSRSHAKFVRNIPVKPDNIRSALRKAWNADEIFAPPSMADVEPLIRDQYANDAWNFRR